MRHYRRKTINARNLESSSYPHKPASRRDRIAELSHVGASAETLSGFGNRAEQVTSALARLKFELPFCRTLAGAGVFA
jgi:hypothetical protein